MDDNLVGSFIATIVDAVINKLMVQVCFVDVIFSGLVKMRLFNGYMADDVVLTSFCVLAGYSAELNKQFSSGAKEMQKEIKRQTELEKQREEMAKKAAEGGDDKKGKFGRAVARTKSMPPIAFNRNSAAQKDADAQRIADFLKSIEGDIKESNSRRNSKREGDIIAPGTNGTSNPPGTNGTHQPGNTQPHQSLNQPDAPVTDKSVVVGF